MKGKKGLFYGIDVTKGKGLNDGSVKGVSYFKPKHKLSGRFVSCTKQIEIIQQTAYVSCQNVGAVCFFFFFFFFNCAFFLWSHVSMCVITTWFICNFFFCFFFVENLEFRKNNGPKNCQ